MSWTDDRIDSLKRLWGDGLSASQIASQLGGISRNAVIGKVHRLKLESRITKPAPSEAAQRDAVPKTAMSTVSTLAPPPAPPRIVVASPAPPVPPRMVPALVAEPIETAPPPLDAADETTRTTSAEVVPITRNLTLVQLSERTCKWPLGDPLSDEFRFCGNHSRDASPYCAYHARLAFQPASERRRVR